MIKSGRPQMCAVTILTSCKPTMWTVGCAWRWRGRPPTGTGVSTRACRTASTGKGVSVLSIGNGARRPWRPVGCCRLGQLASLLHVTFFWCNATASRIAHCCAKQAFGLQLACRSGRPCAHNVCAAGDAEYDAFVHQNGRRHFTAEDYSRRQQVFGDNKQLIEVRSSCSLRPDGAQEGKRRPELSPDISTLLGCGLLSSADALRCQMHKVVFTDRQETLLVGSS